MTDFRLAPTVMARFIGAYLVVLALLLLAATVAVSVAGWNLDLLVVVLVVGILGLLGLAWWARSVVVVRLTSHGYQVRLVRGAGAAEARWSEVEDIVAATTRGIECVVFRLKDGRTTTIPVQVVACDKDDFARAVRDRAAAAAR